jgi:hypothetical protein
MKIVFEIELGNDRMQTPSDVSQAVQRAMSSATREGLWAPLTDDDEGILRDDNGNLVGAWKVTHA